MWNNDAFGTSAPSGSVTVNLRMPGQYYDSESGLFYNNNRTYNPAIGRYISSDPIGIAGGLNTFNYALQTPVMLIDPRGLDQPPPGYWDVFYNLSQDWSNWPTQPDPTQTMDYSHLERLPFDMLMTGLMFVPGLGEAGAVEEGCDAIGSYLASKAPYQVTPGTSELSGFYINDMGRIEPWTAYYDEYGRLIARTDYNAGNATAGIPSTHYHTYTWGPGQTPLETGGHIPGEFIK